MPDADRENRRPAALLSAAQPFDASRYAPVGCRVHDEIGLQAARIAAQDGMSYVTDLPATQDKHVLSEQPLRRPTLIVVWLVI